MKDYIKRLLIMSALLAGVQLTGAQTFTTIYTFTGGNDGGNPNAPLIQAADGLLYGTTPNYGASVYGTVFCITPGGALTTIHSFTKTGIDGGIPRGPLVQARHGTIYGMTFQGGISNSPGAGTIFRVALSSAPTVFSFAGTNGQGPSFGGLIEASDGSLYGSTTLGGAFGQGVIYRFTDNGTNTLLHSLSTGVCDSGLVQASDGNLYGTTSGSGTIFRITTNGVFTTLYSFAGGDDGANPISGLMQASDGNLYGTTIQGGTNSSGTIYRITTDGTYTSLYSFTGGNDGSGPGCTLIQAADGNLYGTAGQGGADASGTIFKFTTNGVFTLLYTFTGGDDGSSPGFGLLQANDGNLYGTTAAGGADGFGTLYKLTITSPPPVNISSTGNQSALYWTGSYTNYLVQSTTNLASTNWVTVSNTTPIVGVTVSNTAPAQYFRLAAP